MKLNLLSSFLTVSILTPPAKGISERGISKKNGRNENNARHLIFPGNTNGFLNEPTRASIEYDFVTDDKHGLINEDEYSIKSGEFGEIQKKNQNVILRDTVTHDMTFETTESNMKDPNPKTGNNDFQILLNDLSQNLDGSRIAIKFMADLVKDLFGINIPGWMLDIANGLGDFSNLKFRPSIKPLLNADVGGYFNVDSIDKGTDAEIFYPVQADVTFPGKNSFQCGSKVRVDTSLENGAASNLDITPPFYEMELGAFIKDIALEIGVGFEIEVCIGLQIPGVGCAGVEEDFSVDEKLTLLPIGNIGNIPIIELCKEAFKEDANIADLVGCGELAGLESVFNIIQSALDTYNEQNNVNYDFAVFEEGKVTLKNPDLPSSVPLPIIETVGEFEIAQKNDLTFRREGKKLTSQGTKQVASLEVDVVDIAAELLQLDTSVSLGGGTGLIDIGDISPTLAVEQEMTYEFDPSLYITFSLSAAMAYDVEDENGNKSSHGFSDKITVEAGHSLVLSFPDNMQTPVDMINSYSVDAMLKVKVDHQYYRSVKLRLFEIDSQPLGLDETLYTQNLAKANVAEATIEDFMFHLGGFNQLSFPETPIRLDPEFPVLELGLQLVHQRNVGNGERSIVVQLDANNDGDVELENLDLRIASESFTFGSCFESPNWMPSTTFEGTRNILAADQGIDVGKSGFIHVEASTRPDRPVILPNGCFDPSSTEQTIFPSGFSNTPIGTFIEAGVNECTQERRTEEIKLIINTGPQEITSISDFTLYGWQNVELSSSMGVSTGNIGSSRYVTVFSEECDGTDTPAEVRGSLHVGKDLRLKKGANIAVDYVQIGNELKLGKSGKSKPGPDASLTVHGALSEDSQCVKTFDLPRHLLEDSTWSESEKGTKKTPSGLRGPKVTISEDETISPGVYSEIVVEEGTTLFLAPGDYKVQKLVVQADVQIVAEFFDDTESVNLDINKWDFACEDKITDKNPKCGKGGKGSEKAFNRGRASVAKGGKGGGMKDPCSFSLLVQDGLPSQLHLNYYGKKDLVFNGSILEGSLVAPEADVSLDDGTVLHGSLYAQNIFVGTDSSFVSHTEIMDSEKSLCS